MAQIEVDIDGAAEARFRQHARMAAPREACGLFGGVSSAAVDGNAAADHADAIVRLSHYVPMRNLASDTDAYRMDPIEVAQVEHALRRSGLALRGVFHSHPCDTATPSDTDARNAWPELVQVILGCDGEWAAWLPRDKRLERLDRLERVQ